MKISHICDKKLTDKHTNKQKETAQIYIRCILLCMANKREGVKQHGGASPFPKIKLC